MQGRGLKLLLTYLSPFPPYVAPHAGAWIETSSFSLASCLFSSPLMQGRGLKLLLAGQLHGQQRRPSCRGVD